VSVVGWVGVFAHLLYVLNLLLAPMTQRIQNFHLRVLVHVTWCTTHLCEPALQSPSYRSTHPSKHTPTDLSSMRTHLLTPSPALPSPNATTHSLAFRRINTENFKQLELMFDSNLLGYLGSVLSIDSM